MKGIAESGDVHIVVNIHIEGLLIVDVGGDTHENGGGWQTSREPQAIVVAKSSDIITELLFTENGIDGCQDERSTGQEGTDFVEAMHGAGGALDDKAKGDGTSLQTITLQLDKMVAYLGCLVVADDDNLIGIIVHEDADETVYKTLVPHPDQWFGLGDTLGGQSRAFTRCYDGISHTTVYR